MKTKPTETLWVVFFILLAVAGLVAFAIFALKAFIWTAAILFVLFLIAAFNGAFD